MRGEKPEKRAGGPRGGGLSGQLAVTVTQCNSSWAPGAEHVSGSALRTGRRSCLVLTAVRGQVLSLPPSCGCKTNAQRGSLSCFLTGTIFPIYRTESIRVTPLRWSGERSLCTVHIQGSEQNVCPVESAPQMRAPNSVTVAGAHHNDDGDT